MPETTTEEAAIGTRSKHSYDVKIDDIVQVTLLDHSENMPSLVLAEVFGRLTGITPESITVESWNVINLDGIDHADNNKTFCIVNRAVKSIVVLIPRDAGHTAS